MGFPFLSSSVSSRRVKQDILVLKKFLKRFPDPIFNAWVVQIILFNSFSFLETLNMDEPWNWKAFQPSLSKTENSWLSFSMVKNLNSFFCLGLWLSKKTQHGLWSNIPELPNTPMEIGKALSQSSLTRFLSNFLEIIEDLWLFVQVNGYHIREGLR